MVVDSTLKFWRKKNQNERLRSWSNQYGSSLEGSFSGENVQGLRLNQVRDELTCKGSLGIHTKTLFSLLLSLIDHSFTVASTPQLNNLSAEA